MLSRIYRQMTRSNEIFQTVKNRTDNWSYGRQRKLSHCCRKESREKELLRRKTPRHVVLTMSIGIGISKSCWAYHPVLVPTLWISSANAAQIQPSAETSPTGGNWVSDQRQLWNERNWNLCTPGQTSGLCNRCSKHNTTHGKRQRETNQPLKHPTSQRKAFPAARSIGEQ